MKRKLPIFSIIAGGWLITFCSSWGFLVHRTVAQLAIYQLPRPMRSFFFAGKAYLVRESVRPDQRRNTDPAEAPRHFIDLEAYGDSSAWRSVHDQSPAGLMPMTEEEAVRRYSRDTLNKYGFVPYEIMRVKALLTNAFRSGDKDSVLFYATDLGHYIGDANVPLHTSVNYDGQLTGQKGLHALWESLVPDQDLNQYRLRDRRRARYLKDPAAAVWEAIRHSSSLLKDVFAQEKEATREIGEGAKYRTENRNGREYRTYSPAFIKAYGARLGATVNEQLLRSADLIADFWYTAWVDAGKPDLDAMLTVRPDRKYKRAMKSEYKLYRKNQLIERQLLMARQMN